jgi:putative hydrolase of the HAD superfamily
MSRFTLKALIVDVDGVLINGRSRDEKHWSTDLVTDLGLSPSLFYERFFTPYWDKIVTGKLDLLSASNRCFQIYHPTSPQRNSSPIGLRMMPA